MPRAWAAPHRGHHARERFARTARRGGLPKDEGKRAAASPNLLDRRFAAGAPNRKWIADFTEIWTAEGWLYVAAVIDVYPRGVVSGSMQTGMTAQLVTDDRAQGPTNGSHTGRGSGGWVRRHRALRQLGAPALAIGPSPALSSSKNVPRSLLGRYPPNRKQARRA